MVLPGDAATVGLAAGVAVGPGELDGLTGLGVMLGPGVRSGSLGTADGEADGTTGGTDPRPPVESPQALRMVARLTRMTRRIGRFMAEPSCGCSGSSVLIAHRSHVAGW